jgi:ketosteroid isomerase-like protein
VLTRSLFHLIALSLVAALAATNATGARTQTAKQRAVAKAISEMDDAWSRAASNHNLKVTLAYYAKGAVMLPPNAPIATTAKGLKDNWVPMCASGTKIGWKATKVEVSKSLDMAYSYGTYFLTMKVAGKTTKDQGKWVEVWKKQTDGSWKCVVDTFNSDLAAAG